MRVAIIIPTLNPKEKFTETVKQLKENFDDVVVINDGSSSEYDFRFDEASQLGCIVLKHDVNKGKGAGIKTGIEYIKKNLKSCDAAITVDADGQHLLNDVIKVKECFEKVNTVVLGTRDFSLKNIPLRSRFGNKFSSLFFKLSTGVACPDTQTGLRCYPKELFKFALSIPGDRFEYEMNFLKECTYKKVKLVYEPIETVYENKKKQESHFRPLRDSFLIYQDQAKYITSSLLSTIADLTLFHFFTTWITFGRFSSIFYATIFARVISGTLNFCLNKFWTFKSKNSIKKEAIKYGLLSICQATLSSILVSLVDDIFATFGHKPILVLVKLIVDCLLFVVSFFVQKRVIFKKEYKKK